MKNYIFKTLITWLPRMVSDTFKYRYIVIFCTILITFLSVLPGYADIYLYIDKEGNYYFTDTPKSSEYRLFIREKRPKPLRSHSTNKYDKYIEEASRRHGVAFSLLKAIMKVESDFDPRAVSKKGAKGLMQIMPGNFGLLGIKNPFNPRENILGGARYFTQLLNQFNGNTELALAAYNAGPVNVSNAKGIPRIKETENFVKQVMKYYHGLERDRRFIANNSR